MSDLIKQNPPVYGGSIKVYQINDWDAYFENDRSRTRKHCSFVCVPNKQDGMGFRYIMSEPDGAAIYGIWNCILGACSKQRFRNGWLTTNGQPVTADQVADGERAGSPWGEDDLAVKFNRPQAEIKRALEVLCSQKVGWLTLYEITAESPGGNRTLTAQSPPTNHTNTAQYLEGKGREGKGREVAPAAHSADGLSSGKFKKPTLEDVRKLITEKGMPETEGDIFWNFYDSKGWKVGKNQMVSLASAIGGWFARWKKENGIGSPKTAVFRNKSKIEQEIQSKINEGIMVCEANGQTRDANGKFHGQLNEYGTKERERLRAELDALRKELVTALE
jgi:hypothetical protein